VSAEMDITYNSDEFGKRLKQIRRTRGMTQEKLAELLCLSVDSVSKYENGKTTCMPEHVTKICQILNIYADYLYFGVEKELLQGNGGKMELITNILQSCSDFDLDRVYGMLQILLQSPAA
jgi:transcriptional regulator with XRE-family HTH domain